jgi:hypothetical protein
VLLSTATNGRVGLDSKSEYGRGTDAFLIKDGFALNSHWKINMLRLRKLEVKLEELRALFAPIAEGKPLDLPPPVHVAPWIHRAPDAVDGLMRLKAPKPKKEVVEAVASAAPVTSNPISIQNRGVLLATIFRATLGTLNPQEMQDFMTEVVR